MIVVLYRANMVRTISVRVSEDLYARVNKMLESTCFNLSWLVRMYLVALCDCYLSLPSVCELQELVEHVAEENNFFSSAD